MTTSTFNQEKFDAITKGLAYAAVFVPKNQSRNKDEKCPSMNWRITITHNKQTWQGDYGQGSGCLSERDLKRAEQVAGPRNFSRKTIAWGEMEKSISESGKIGIFVIARPELKDVLCSLLSDASALDCASFEEWAEDLGFDTDSRKAEATYRECLAIGLKLRAMFGDESLGELRALFQDY